MRDAELAPGHAAKANAASGSVLPSSAPRPVFGRALEVPERQLQSAPGAAAAGSTPAGQAQPAPAAAGPCKALGRRAAVQLALALLALLAATAADKLGHRRHPLFLPLVGIALVVLFTLLPVELPCGRWSVPLDMRTTPVLTVGALLLGGMETRLLWEAPIGTASLCPLEVMVVFYGMAYLCLSVNETGLLRHIALRAASYGRSREHAFLVVALVTGVLTLTTSNDVVILGLTPVIIHFCAEKGYDPLPFLYMEFATANIWSITLLIGNPTNVIAAGPAGLTFGRYFVALAPAGVVSGLVSVAVVYLLFLRRSGAEKPRGDSSPEDGGQRAAEALPPVEPEAPPPAVLWRRAYVSAGRLVLTLGFASLDDVHHVELWVTVAFASVAALLSDALMDVIGVSGTRGLTLATLKGLPWEVFLFALSLFIIVQALDLAGLVGALARVTAAVARHGVFAVTFFMGAASILACQLLNNQPMTVLFAKVLSHPDFVADPPERIAAFAALIIGSNLGANVTLIGALAGPMWAKVCRANGVTVGHGQFCRAMVGVTPPVAAAGLAVLCLEVFLLGPALADSA